MTASDSELSPEPYAFTAFTCTKYAVPFVKPEIVIGEPALPVLVPTSALLEFVYHRIV